MNLWGWIIAYVIGFSLLQVLIYRYLRGRDNGTGGSASERSFERTAPPREHGGADRGSAVTEQSLAADPLYTASEPGTRGPSMSSGRQCPRCGTPNELDPTFTYCRECVRPLG